MQTETRNGETHHIDTLISAPCRPLTLQFTDISYRVKPDPQPQGGERAILSNVTGQVRPGEVVAVLGPSGSGKSTLLTILAGRSRARHSGSVLANGAPLTKTVMRRVGYVAQEDVLHPHLTVRETLVYCAMLRLPRAVARPEKARAADGVIAELGLGKCADTAVMGVSGGERKRVAIGHEMLVSPSLLILDEPTSGLDSTAAGRLVETLCGLARRGRAVVTSIHQPASGVFRAFDSVMLLCDGCCVYFGRGGDAMGYFGEVGFVPGFHVNPADFMLDLANGCTQIEYNSEADKSRVKQSLVSSYNRVLAPKMRASVNASISASAGVAVTIANQRAGDKGKVKDLSGVGWIGQFTILLSRSLKERRHETFNTLRVLQVVAAALLAGSMWWQSSIGHVQDRLGLLFFVSIFWGVFASFNAVFTFPQERAIFVKERASGMYTLSSYFMARMAGDLPMELVLPAVFTVILYWMAGLRPEVGAFLLTLAVLLGYVLVAQGLGLVVGATIMDAKQASTVVTVTMLAFLITGGFYVQHVPSSLTWMKYVSFTFYCYRLLIGVQYRGDEMDRYLGPSRYGHGPGEGEIVRQISVGTSILALVAMFFAYRVLAYAALRRIKV